MLDDAPTPVTKTRRWKTVAYFEVEETPDPVFDVAACERLADRLYTEVGEALETVKPGTTDAVQRVKNVYVEDVMPEDD